MSRYTVQIGTVEYAYGFDRPLQEYFFEKLDSQEATDKNDEGYIYQISTHMSLLPHPESPNKSSYNRGEILSMIEIEEKLMGRVIVLEEHKQAIAGDLVF